MKNEEYGAPNGASELDTMRNPEKKCATLQAQLDRYYRAWGEQTRRAKRAEGALRETEARSASWAHGYQRLHYGHQHLIRSIGGLKAWAERQIEQCRTDEAKFGAAVPAIDACRERMVLQEVLRQIEAALSGDPVEDVPKAPNE